MRVAGSDVRSMGRTLEILHTLLENTEEGEARRDLTVTLNTIACVLRTMRETQ